ncbi:hypothetical protein DSUL_50265 [Desulfovibrionales bacterium]
MRVLNVSFLHRLADDLAAFTPDRSPHCRAILSRNVASKYGLENYNPVAAYHTTTGLPLAVPVPNRSGLLRSLLDAEGLVTIPADIKSLNAGSEVQVHLFDI